MPNVNIRVPEGEFEQLEQIKNKRGLTWEGMLKYGFVEELE
jgi:hypothetical protein